MPNPYDIRAAKPLTARLLALAGIFLVIATPLTANAATLSQLESELSQAQQQLSYYQNLQNQAASQKDQYASQINQQQAQINSVEANIADLNSSIKSKENDIASTQGDIANKVAQLNTLTDQLNNALVSLYEFTPQTEVMVASNNDISYFVDQSEYLQTLQEDLVTKRDQVSQIKKQLEGKQKQLQQQEAELAAIKGQQEQQDAQLSAAQNQTQNLLTQASQQEQHYKAAAKAASDHRDNISAQLIALREQLSRQGREVYVSGGSGYPYAPGQVDPWQFYTGQCTSYVAWKLYAIYGKPFYGQGQGDAYNWPSLAASNGYRTSKTPRAGAAIAWGRSYWSPYYGHVAYVENVNSDGTINISEYNYAISEGFDRRDNVAYWNYGASYTFIYP